MVMLGLEEALTPDFTSNFPAKEIEVFNLITEEGQKMSKCSEEEQEGNDAICALLSESCSIKQAQLCF
jgi:hypothetical protein